MKRNFSDIKDSDEEDAEIWQKENPKKFEVKTEAIIYWLDAREKMFLPSFEEAKLPFIRCLESIRRVIRNKIFRSEKCLCSIILLGTKKSENPLKLNNITVVQELNFLGAEHVLKINELIKAVENLTFEKEYGYDKFSLGDAFWCSSYTFNQRSYNLNKSIIFFTNDDGPVSDDPNDENRAITNAQDLCKSSVTFDLLHLGKDFDVNKFYKKIVLASKNDTNYVIPDPVTNINEIVDRISKTNYRHVSLVKLPFSISDDFQIGVSIHFLVRKSKIPFKTKLSKATNEKVSTKVQYFEEETGSLVKKEDLIKCQVFAEKNIDFNLAELKTIQDFGSKELRLLGFKPASVLRIENFVKPCAFIYPDDTQYKGSSLFFTALLKRCIAKQVVAICTFCPRTTSSCRFVALIAQDQFSQDDKSQELPPGFVVFFLPFAEEVRTIENNAKERATPEQVKLAVNLIKKLKFKYKVNSFQNPKLQQHWAAIEALALDLKEPEEVNDSIFPNYDLISQRSGDIINEFIKLVYEDYYEPEYFSAPKKARPKTVITSTVAGVEDVEEYVTQGKGEQLGNEVLRCYLRSVGHVKSLSKVKKSDLLEKIRSHLNLN